MMLANGVYTIENEAGDHRTISIRTQAQDAKFAPGERIAAILAGPDNEEDYQGFAFVKDTGFCVWRKKRGQNGRISTFEWYAKILEAIDLEPSEMEEVEVDVELAGRKYTVMVSKRCIRCNRKLTTPESIRAGIGPVCAGRE
jgi:hypothetical protein